MTSQPASTGWRSLAFWSVVALFVVLTAVSFLMWGRNGPAYLVDLIAAYCL